MIKQNNNRQSFSTIANDRITALYCRLSRDDELQEFIDKSKEQTLNVDSFLKAVRKYTDIKELTAEITRSFVERIDVYKPEKVPGTRTKKQTICIHWNFIGAVDIPAEHEKTA